MPPSAVLEGKGEQCSEEEKKGEGAGSGIFGNKTSHLVDI